MATRIAFFSFLLLAFFSCKTNCLDVNKARNLTINGSVELHVSVEPDAIIYVGDTIWITSIIKNGDIYTDTDYCNLPSFESGAFKILLEFSVYRNESPSIEEYINNFPYCERIAIIGKKELLEPSHQSIYREYFRYLFYSINKSYNLEIGCIFLEPGSFTIGPSFSLINNDLMENTFPLVYVSIDAPISPATLGATYSQTNSGYFLLTVMERK